MKFPRFWLWLGIWMACLQAAQASEQDFLLHTPVAPALLDNLRIWDAQQHLWRAMRTGESPARRPVLVVHLWADYCKPCKEEFPLFRALAEAVERENPGQVGFVYLSETSDAAAMDRFLIQNHPQMPRGPLYLDTGEAIAQLVSRHRPNGQKTLPITIVLDEQRVIRQAVIGPIGLARGTLSTGITKLVRLPRQMTQPPRSE